MLPLLVGAPEKKRKSSSIDPNVMWTDSRAGPSSAASASAALTRNRAFLLMLVLMVFMFFSMSSTTLLQKATESTTRSRLRGPTEDGVVVTGTNGNSHVMTFPEAMAAAAATQHPRAPSDVTKATRPDSFGIVVVADLDKKSKDTTSKKPLFFSYLQHGTLKIARRGEREEYSVEWGETQKFSTTMNEAGRGFELSELAWFNGKLLSFDDRTGIVYRLKNFDVGKRLQAIPEHIIMEGDGVASKGQKHEWATVKDEELYMGSVGKEYTDNDGNLVGDSNLWVAVMDKQGDVRHEDWTSNFARVRKALGADYPGYVVHEAIEWSSVHRKWFILPRRVSKEAYNDELDERRGSNKLVIASEDFSSIEVLEVGKITPLRGFSSFKFVPRSDDSVIVAIKSVEIEAEQSQTSFLTVFDIRGNVLLEETELPGGHKFEGVAFSHDWST
ncbi:hypothetical protein Poli38472_001558 [Pythium oligandrum]|uniref:Apyrase n=1 Tax=Pythium oligandrum TaxID=41045 RepID=A0A8K1CV16_PYTOL|nr:hypothetical protein Poli38472_001558 [Pythium oligandrum]|eukprot:TMW69402.1 hypothetical protein Poli38472_001558 [Pythium oligandrum]